MQKRILIVDDDQRLRELLMRYLNEQGFDVRATSDAASMELALGEESFDQVSNESLGLGLAVPGELGERVGRGRHCRGGSLVHEAPRPSNHTLCWIYRRFSMGVGRRCWIW